ncbi:CDP-glycerol glycerophosphotransferase family protein [Patescibacteria group bacterium]|nr:CDP-glycerol glycerophosphotransferase family protein [Patescibacteria group bacterium]
MRTIFITSFHGLVSRVLQSGLLDLLKKDEELRIVILVPDFKKDYFIKNFSDKSIIIESVSEKELSKKSLFFHKISFFLLNTKSMKIIRRSYRDYTNYPRFLLTQSTAVILGRWKLIRNLFRQINYYFSGKPIFKDLFEKYKPELIFSMDVKHPFDTELLIEARKRKIFTIAMVRSWDYLTAKGITRVMPHKMIVHNEIIKNEAIKYADMNPENIEVIGMPHFDPYINYPRSEKKEFFKKIKGDSDKPLILWAPLGDKFSDLDSQFFEILCEAIKKEELPKDLQVLVRVPPGDTLNLHGLKPCPNLIFDYPGSGFEGMHRKANEMSLVDLLHLADSLFYSSLVVTCASTICIDATVFDKPIIYLGFDAKEKRDYYESIINHYDYDHTRNILKTNGVEIAISKQDLIKLINKYLKNPELKREERKIIVKEQCWKFDGQASQRLADYILSFLK